MFKTNRNKKEKGQGLVEYALILVLVAIVVIAVLTLLGPRIAVIFARIEAPTAVAGNAALQAYIQTCEQTQGQFAVHCSSSNGFIANLYDKGTLIHVSHTSIPGTSDYLDCAKWAQ